MRRAVLVVALLFSSLGLVSAQEHVTAFLMTGDAELRVDSVMLDMRSGRQWFVTRDFGGPPETEDTFDFGAVDWPDAVLVMYIYNGEPMEPLEIRPVEPRVWTPIGTSGASQMMFDRISGVVEANKGAVGRTALSVAANPVRERAVLKCNTTKSGPVLVEVFDGTGQLVRTLFHGYLAAGSYNLHWNRRDDAGRLMSAGLYLARFSAGNARYLAKVIVTD